MNEAEIVVTLSPNVSMAATFETGAMIEATVGQNAVLDTTLESGPEILVSLIGTGPRGPQGEPGKASDIDYMTIVSRYSEVGNTIDTLKVIGNDTSTIAEVEITETVGYAQTKSIWEAAS